MSSFEITGVPVDELNVFLAGAHPDPFRILGPHRVGDDLVVRIFRPDAKEAAVLVGEERFPADRLRPEGFFQATLPGMNRTCDYQIHLTGWDGSTATVLDPYCYGLIMSELDLHLFAEGNNHCLYEQFGAHLRTIAGVQGVYFAVWAPNAQRVSVVGDFNGWDGRVNPMRQLVASGVWELFLPGVGERAHYKFEIRTPRGALLLKADPFGFFSQHGKETSSMVYNLDRYRWSDGEWMEARPAQKLHTSAISIYEVHLGSWRRKAEERNRSLSYL